MKCKVCGFNIPEVEGSKVWECPACGEQVMNPRFVAKSPKESSKPPVDNGIDKTELIEKMEKSMIIIHGYVDGGYKKGTGFFLNYGGELYCVTNNHVISETTSIDGFFPKSVDPDQEAYVMTVLATDPINDVALLSCSADNGKYKPLISRRTLELGNIKDAKKGEDVCTIGNPRYLENIYAPGCISGIGEGDYSPDRNKGGANKFLLNMDVTHGNSGGAVCSFKTGKVIGIITCGDAKLSGYVACVSSSTIEHLLLQYTING